MTMTKGQEVHPGTVWVWRDPNERWPLATCSFCGSIKSEDAIRLIKEGNDTSGSEWKNSWPHKFYVWGENNVWRFYNEHLTELDMSEFREVSGVFAEVFKISFEYDVVGRLKFRSPGKDYMTWRIDGVLYQGGAQIEPSEEYYDEYHSKDE